MGEEGSQAADNIASSIIINKPAVFVQDFQITSHLSAKVSSLVQSLLLSLAVLLAALLRGHLVRLGRSGVGVERSELGILALLLDGLDGELLLALSRSQWSFGHMES